MEDTQLFIGLSFAIRIVEAMGNAGFLTASFAIIAKEFPDNVATTFVSIRRTYCVSSFNSLTTLFLQCILCIIFQRIVEEYVLHHERV